MSRVISLIFFLWIHPTQYQEQIHYSAHTALHRVQCLKVPLVSHGTSIIRSQAISPVVPYDLPQCLMVPHKVSGCLMMSHRYLTNSHGVLYNVSLCLKVPHDASWCLKCFSVSWCLIMSRGISWCLIVSHDVSWFLMESHSVSFWSSICLELTVGCPCSCKDEPDGYYTHAQNSTYRVVNDIATRPPIIGWGLIRQRLIARCPNVCPRKECLHGDL